MTDTIVSFLTLTAALVCGGATVLYWQASRESARLDKLAEADKTRRENVYEIHLGRGAGSGEKRAADAGDSAAPHIINIQPRIPRACAPTVRLIDGKEKP
jgi:hypothetical protein